MDELQNLIAELATKVAKQEQINEAVSKASVGWHIGHICLASNSILDALKKSNPNDYRWSFNMKRVLVFTMNKIPRGKAQAPNAVRPKSDFDTEFLKAQIKLMSEKILDLKNLDRNNYFNHPFFGPLNLKSTVKFLSIHTKHHLHIINDIIKAENQ